MTTVLGIADGRALGCSVRLVTTAPDQLLAAKAAIDRVLDDIDVARAASARTASYRESTLHRNARFASVRSSAAPSLMRCAVRA